MSETSEFKLYPLTYLASKVMIVPDATDGKIGPLLDNKPAGINAFKIVTGDKNAVWLDVATDVNDSINAYYLPWKSKASTTLTLGADADYFFTSQLTGCRFRIVAGEGTGTPLVCHTAGDLSSPRLRDGAEKDAGIDPAVERPGRGRSLSISGGSSSAGNVAFKVPPRVQQHEYRGQNGKAENHSSAFVFGKRYETGEWRFYVQVTKGVRNELAGITLSEDLTVLKFNDLSVRQL